jgi:hypothetical protein
MRVQAATRTKLAAVSAITASNDIEQIALELASKIITTFLPLIIFSQMNPNPQNFFDNDMKVVRTIIAHIRQFTKLCDVLEKQSAPRAKDIMKLVFAFPPTDLLNGGKQEINRTQQAIKEKINQNAGRYIIATDVQNWLQVIFTAMYLSPENFKEISTILNKFIESGDNNPGTLIALFKKVNGMK